MKRNELEHILRAASAVTNQPNIVVIGSQSILAQFPDAPVELLASIEADVFPRSDPALSIQIDGAIGERSLFHQTFGYYAHGVDETTATLPSGWQDRLIPIRNENTGGATGWCLDVHDLAVSKLVAGREKDLLFIRGLLKHGLANPARIEELLRALSATADILSLVRARLHRLTSTP